jgi:hypothetical protein
MAMQIRRCEEFATQLVDIINCGTLWFMISIGHSTRLFDIKSSLQESAAVEEISRAAGLSERYVKEWLEV